MIEFWWDGCCEPVNPGGHAAYGTHIERDGEVLLSESGYCGHGPEMSNNVAEYSGFIRALEFLLEKGLQKEKIHGRGDSNLVVRQQFPDENGVYWRMRGGMYIPYAKKAKQLVPKFRRLTAEWIPRDQNDKADELSKQVLKNKRVEFRIQPE